MSDLASLLQTAPYAASFMMGQQNQADLVQKQIEAQRLRELVTQLQQKNAYDQQANPLELEKLKFGNQYDSQVKLPSGLEDLTAKKLGNQLTQATQPGTIATTNANNALKTATDTTGLARDMQNRLMTIGSTVQGAPPPLRVQAFQKALQDQGIDPNHPLAQGMTKQLQSRDPNAFGQYIKAQADLFGDIASRQNTEYLGKKYSADQNLAGDKVKAGATVKAAEIAAESRKAVADTRKETNNFWNNYYKQKSAVGQYNMLKSQATKLTGDGDEEGAKQLLEMAKEVYPRAKAEFEKTNNPKPDLAQLGVPTLPPTPFPDEGVSGAGGPGPAGFTGQTKSGIKFKVVPQ
jgi:hypothetical protein